MNDADLFERYKESLKAGHLAVLRGRLSEAEGAYRKAASLAPNRALPRTSLGSLYARGGRYDEAALEYETALTTSPYDQEALLGLAGALVHLNRSVEARSVLVRLRGARGAAGLEPDDAEQGLVEAVATALGLDVTLIVPGFELVARSSSPPVGTLAPSIEAEIVTDPAALLLTAAWSSLDQARRNPSAASAAADLVDAARAFEGSGHQDAALGAAWESVRRYGASTEAHLLLAELWRGRGWQQAVEKKLDLLERWAELTADEGLRDRVMTARFGTRRQVARK